MEIQNIEVVTIESEQDFDIKNITATHYLYREWYKIGDDISNFQPKFVELVSNGPKIEARSQIVNRLTEYCKSAPSSKIIMVTMNPKITFVPTTQKVSQDYYESLEKRVRECASNMEMAGVPSKFWPSIPPRDDSEFEVAGFLTFALFCEAPESIN